MQRLMVEVKSASQREAASEFFAQVWLSDKTAREPEWEYALAAATAEEAEGRITTSEDDSCWVIQTAIGNTPRFPKSRFCPPRIVRR